jgi:hypothetical protein
MARRKKQKLDLATAFQGVTNSLVQNQARLNQADEYNHDHGDHMVEIFGMINEAVAAKEGKKPAEQLAYASELVGQRSQSGSAKMYAEGLAKASRQFKGKAVTPDNLSTLLGSLLGGEASGEPSSGTSMDLLGTLLGGVAGQTSTSSSPSAPADLIGSLLGGGGEPGSNSPADLMGSLLGGGEGGSQASSSQPGLDLGDIVNAGMAFMSSQQQGEGTVQSLIKAFVSATQAGQKPHRAQSGELVANTLVQMLGKRGGR